MSRLADVALASITTELLSIALQPWTDLVVNHHTKCRLKNEARVDHGVIFQFQVPFQRLHKAGAHKLREAIDLVVRLLAVDPLLARFLRNRDRSRASVGGLSDKTIARVLKQGAPWEIHVTIKVDQKVDLNELKELIADELYVNCSHAASNDDGFVRVRGLLDTILKQDNSHWMDTVKQPVMCWLEAHCLAEPRDEQEADTFVTQLVKFVETMNRDVVNVPVENGGHLPVQFMFQEGLCLDPMPVTPTTVQLISKLASLRQVPLKCHVIRLDPRHVTCSFDELGKFLSVLAAERCSVVLVPYFMGIGADPFASIDNAVPNPVAMIEGLLRTLVACDNAYELHIGLLLRLFRSPGNRAVIYRELVRTIFTRSEPLKLSLWFGHVTAEDSKMLTAQVQMWRALYPTGKLKVTELCMNLYDADNSFTRALVDALDEVEELEIHNRDDDAPPLSHELVEVIVDKFQMVRELSLCRVHLETMKLLSYWSPPRKLEGLTLCGLTLDEEDSFAQFIIDFGYPLQSLGGHLRRLKISDYEAIPLALRVEGVSRMPGIIRLQTHEVNVLAEALKRNKLLESVSVCLEQQDECSDLYKTQGMRLVASDRVRNSFEEKNRRLAFLSVLHNRQGDVHGTQRPLLDSFLVRYILTFSDPWVQRCIFAE